MLPCTHFYGIETLDGLFEMENAYEKSESGEYLATKSLFDSGISDLPMKCPECRAPITLVRRYGRVLNYKSLQVLERKHMTLIERTLYEISQLKKKDTKSLLKLREEIQATPMRTVQDACRSLKSSDNVEVPGTYFTLVLKWLDLTSSVFAA